MYYYYKPQLKIKDGAATADYKSLIRRTLAMPAAEQQSLFVVKQKNKSESF